MSLWYLAGRGAAAGALVGIAAGAASHGLIGALAGGAACALLTGLLGCTVWLLFFSAQVVTDRGYRREISGRFRRSR